MKTYIVKVKDAEIPKEQYEEQIIERILQRLKSLYQGNEYGTVLFALFVNGFGSFRYHLEDWIDNDQFEYLKRQGITDLVSIHKIDKHHDIDQFFAKQISNNRDRIYGSYYYLLQPINIILFNDVKNAYPMTMSVVKDIAEKINASQDNDAKIKATLQTKLNNKLNNMFSNIQDYIDMRINVTKYDDDIICDIYADFEKYFESDEIKAIVKKISSTLRSIFKHVKIEDIYFYEYSTRRNRLNVAAKCNL